MKMKPRQKTYVTGKKLANNSIVNYGKYTLSCLGKNICAMSIL